MQKKTKYLIVFGLILIVYYFFNRHPINGGIIHFSNFNKVEDNIYVSPNTSKEEINLLLATLKKSYDRNDSIIWGKINRNKKILFCADYETFSTYCPDTLNQAVFLSSPYLSHIVIGPKGLNVDVLSHELCHSEFFERLGSLAWYKNKFLVPAWFDEGLAMQVTFDKNYNTDEWSNYIKENKNKLKQIRSIWTYNQFLKDENKIWFNYFASKLEVEIWLKTTKKKGLFELIYHLNKFHNFNTSYNKIKIDYTPL